MVGFVVLVLGVLVFVFGCGVGYEFATGEQVFSLPAWALSTSALFQLILTLGALLVGGSLFTGGYAQLQGKKQKRSAMTRKLVGTLILALGVLVFTFGCGVGYEFATSEQIFSLPTWATGTSALFQSIVTLGALLIGGSLAVGGYAQLQGKKRRR